MRKPGPLDDSDLRLFEASVAEAINRLYEIIPQNANFEFPPEVAVEYGEPAYRIVEVAKQCGADLIVIGVRDAAGRPVSYTHLDVYKRQGPQSDQLAQLVLGALALSELSQGSRSRSIGQPISG